MSHLSSAIHNTGHYHARARPVCSSSSCARSANNGHSRRSSRVLASLNLATRDARAVTNESAYRLQRTCAESAAGMLCLVFVRSQFGAGQRRIWGRRPRPSDGKIKGARCGQVGEVKKSGISASCGDVRFWPTTSVAIGSIRSSGRRASASPTPRLSKCPCRRSSTRPNSRPCRRCSRRAARRSLLRVSPATRHCSPASAFAPVAAWR